MVQIKVKKTLCAGKRYQSVRIMLFIIANAGTFTTLTRVWLKASLFQKIAKFKKLANNMKELRECTHAHS